MSSSEPKSFIELVRDEEVVEPFRSALYELSALAIINWDKADFDARTEKPESTYRRARGFMDTYDALDSRQTDSGLIVVSTSILDKAVFRHYPFFSGVKLEIAKLQPEFDLQQALSYIPEKSV